MSKTRRYLVEPNGIYEKSPLITLNEIYGELAYFSIYNVGGGDQMWISMKLPISLVAFEINLSIMSLYSLKVFQRRPMNTCSQNKKCSCNYMYF